MLKRRKRRAITPRAAAKHRRYIETAIADWSLSNAEIADHLNRLGIRSFLGHRWDAGLVRDFKRAMLRADEHEQAERTQAWRKIEVEAKVRFEQMRNLFEKLADDDADLNSIQFELDDNIYFARRHAEIDQQFPLFKKARSLLSERLKVRLYKARSKTLPLRG